MSPLFKLGERRRARSMWQIREDSVAAGIATARDQLMSASTDDERRHAEQKLTRFEFTANRLMRERANLLRVARMLAR